MQTFNVSMTSQRQVTYPKELVDKLGLNPGEKFTITIIDEGEKLTKQDNFESFLCDISGSIPIKNKNIDFKKARKIAQEEMTKKYYKKFGPGGSMV